MGVCYKSATVWQFAGNVLLILKILIPIVLIILGTIEFGKATISSDEKAMRTTAMKLLKKILIGVAIFFIPTLIRIVFYMVVSFDDEMRNEFENCVTCLTNPSNGCDTSYRGEIFKK